MSSDELIGLALVILAAGGSVVAAVALLLHRLVPSTPPPPPDYAPVVEAVGRAVADAITATTAPPPPAPVGSSEMAELLARAGLTDVELVEEEEGDELIDWTADWIPDVAAGPNVMFRGGGVEDDRVLPEPGEEWT